MTKYFLNITKIIYISHAPCFLLYYNASVGTYLEYLIKKSPLQFAFESTLIFRRSSKPLLMLRIFTNMLLRLQYSVHNDINIGIYYQVTVLDTIAIPVKYIGKQYLRTIQLHVVSNQLAISVWFDINVISSIDLTHTLRQIFKKKTYVFVSKHKIIKFYLTYILRHVIHTFVFDAIKCIRFNNMFYDN